MSDHQFTRRRVYPALVSFWNQFQHELDRITGGLGYGISFDLEIPELTERTKAKAEIARIRGEALVNLISAGASGPAAVQALGLPDTWLAAAEGVYSKGLAGELLAPVAIDYEAPEPAKSTVDEAKTCPKELVADVIHGHNCTCHHSLDKLPEMTKEEKQLYDLLVELAGSLMDRKPEEAVSIDEVITKMVEILEDDAKMGAEEGAQGLALLAKEDVANEILKTVSGGEVYISEALKERIRNRATVLANGYSDYTKQIVEDTLMANEGLTANEMQAKLEEALPRARAEMIARNETVYAIKSGRLEQDESLAEKYGLQVKLVWRTSHDNKVCPICAAMDGQEVDLGKAFVDSVETEDGIVSWEHSAWNDNGKIPDAHVNCVLGDTKVLAEGVKVATKMNYSGEVVELSTKNGRSITTTPNHILLTARGWVLAKNITESDQVIAYSDRVKPFVGNNAIDGDIPTISEQFVTVSESEGVVTSKMPATTKDFKGDGTKDEEIDVVFVDGLLSDKGKTSFDKFGAKLPFVSGSIQNNSLSRISTLDQLLMGTLATSHGIMGGECEALALLGSEGSHTSIHRLTSTTAYNARLLEAKSNRSTTTPESFSKSFLANAGLIEFDDVIGVKVYSVHDTPVYDLETTSTLYTANGIVSSNCRCYFDEVLV